MTLVIFSLSSWNFFIIIYFFLPLPKSLHETKLLINLGKTSGGFIEKQKMLISWSRPPTRIRATFHVINYDDIYYICYAVIYDFQQRSCMI